jgi:PAS domain S-box-containing protein
MIEAKTTSSNPELLALQNAGAAIASSSDLDYILDVVSQEMINLLGVEGCAIFRWNQDKGTISLLVERGPDGKRALAVPADIYFLADAPLINRVLIDRCAQQISLSQAKADPAELTRMQEAKIKSLLVLPMECYGQLVGVVQVVEGQGERVFTIPEIALAQLLANQTASAIENARLYQVDRSHRQELEIVQNVSLSLTASLELSDVFDAILSAALELVAAEDAHIFLYDAGRLTFGAMMTPAGRQEQPISDPRPHGLTYTVARQGEPFMIPDMAKHPLYADSPPNWHGAIIGMPLKIGERVVGVMNTFCSHPYTFSEGEIRALHLLADQAAIAIENARLYAETQQRAQQLAVLHELDQAVSASLHLADIYHTCARHAARIINFDHISINLLEDDEIRVNYVTDREGTLTSAKSKLPLKSSAAGWVITQGQPLLRHNVAADSRFVEDEQLVKADIQSGMVIPLRYKRQIIGAWSIGSRKRSAYTPDDLELAQAIADQLANAIENARLYKQARQEITERKQAEAALRASEERFRQVISSISDWIYMTRINEDGSRINLYLSSHVETLTGYPYEKFMADWNFWPSGIIHPEDRTAAAEQSARLAIGQSSEMEYRLIRADGEIIWVRDSARVESEGDKAKMIYGVVSDITQRKQLEEQFHQSQKMEAIGRLAGGVAHDFNNLLTVINGYSELLLYRHLEGTSPLRRYIEEIRKAGERAASLTGQLLAFSRKQVLQPQIIDLNTVVADMDKLLRRLIGEDIDLVTAPGAESGSVKADPGQIEQVIMNLVVNARDAMPHGGNLTVGTANVTLDETHTRGIVGLEPGPHVVLMVKDTGSGMDPEVMSHIFEPFFTTKEKQKGTGLGLATVYGIVTQSGGYIDVSSKIGAGTTFKVYLPQVDQQVELSKPEQSTEAPHGQETILLVEDEDLVRDLTRTVLLEHGYRVLEASGGSQALSISEEYQSSIDLLATDVVMPHMSGRELAERLLLLRPNIKILYMSGYTDDTIVHHGLADPSITFLQKPFTPAELAHKVREVLDS